ncbi:MAG: hypothetical protein JWO68_1333, partial [Actinomycetia bacterium]|nr:hypothetical protein [Actinomycetes bacterium]
VALAESQLQGVEIAGLIKIDSIRTTAKGTTDGQAATTDQDVVITGVTVQGQGATIDSTGIHLGPQAAPSPLDPVVSGANQALKAFGMEAFVTKPIEQTGAGGAGLVRSGSVVFVWEPPNSGQRFTVVLGGASAQVEATPGSAFGLGGDSFVAPAIGGTDFTPSGDVAVAAVGTGGAPTGGSPTEVITPVGLADASRPTDRVPLGWMLIGLAGMALIGTSFTGLRAKALDAALLGTTCPLERGAS